MSTTTGNNLRTIRVFRAAGQATACPNGCERHTKSTHAAWTEHDEYRAIAATLVAATKARCGCGNHGDWSCSLSGTSGVSPCVWSGCGNCRGTALGVPVLATDLKKWRRLSADEQARYIAEAVIDRGEGGRRAEVEIDMDTIGSTIEYTCPR